MGKLSDSEWKKRKIVHYVVSENAPLFFKTWSSTKMSKCEGISHTIYSIRIMLM